MKKIIITFISLLTLISCSNMENKQPSSESFLRRIAKNETEFKLTDMMLIIKVNHNDKTFNECSGVLPNQSEQEFINQLFNKNKVNNTLLFESKEISEFKDGTFNYIVLNVLEPKLEPTIDNCKKIQEYFLDNNYSMITK